MLALATLILLFAVGSLRAQSAVPPAIQASLLDKIFGYDRTLGDRSQVRVLLVFDPAIARGKDLAEELRKAFVAAKLNAETVPAPAAAGKLGAGVVVYLLPGTARPELLQAAAAAHALTVGEAVLAEQGLATIGLGVRGDKPEIVVNVDRMQAEGHELAAQLLNFARVVRGGEGVQPPVLVSIDKPAYPEVARRLRVQGDVVMRLSVDDTGKVTAVELVKGLSKSGGLDDGAVEAARKARFKPATRDGKPIAGTFMLTMPFRL